MDSPPSTRWTVQDSARLYQIEAWGVPYFAIDAGGRVVVRPYGSPEVEVNLYEVVEGLRERGLHSPVLIRFSDILVHRLECLNRAFRDAMEDHGYAGRYVAAYPIKVNQQRPVVEEVLRHGGRYEYGVEVGSKPELLAVMAMTGELGDRPIICNGFKDEAYIEAVLLAAKLGRTIVPVIENLTEFEILMDCSSRLAVHPTFGLRVKLASVGSGRWSESAGYRSKFGLFATEVLEVVERLREADMLDCLTLLHCHPGSQISDIRALKEAVAELAHVYAGLVELGAGLTTIDVGGGLGVDYDGSESTNPSSVNYSLDAYASEIVHRVGSVCDDQGIPHPAIVTESGRAIAAHQSILVFDVLGASEPAGASVGELAAAEIDRGTEDLPQPVQDLVLAYETARAGDLSDAYHDALQAREEAMRLFGLGYLSLPVRAFAERVFWATLELVRRLSSEVHPVSEDSEALERILGATYFCNLSIFQSLPDSWAIQQLFPVMPIHRLDEEPVVRGVLADITCDSDGKIDRFINPGGRDPKRLIELHELAPDTRYYLAAFLVGAYQETLGDLHNLFGDTHVVHVRVDGGGTWWIEEFVEGDTAEEVLRYVQYDVRTLFPTVRRDCERAVRDGRLSVAESRALQDFYRAALKGYTYLEH